jgi:ribosome-binding factor A
LPTRRQYRVNELILQELQLLIPGRLDDPRLISVSVTAVESTQDLSTAKVYYTCSGSDDECAEVPEALDHSSGVLRNELANIGLRRVPQLVFARDRQYESGLRVIALLDRIETIDPHNVDESAIDPSEEAVDSRVDAVDPRGDVIDPSEEAVDSRVDAVDPVEEAVHRDEPAD